MKIRNGFKLLLFPNYRFEYLRTLGFYKGMDDETYLKKVFKIRTGKSLNLNNPTSFNEKIQWLKLNNKDERYTNMVDKYEAKFFFEKCVGREHVIPTLGVWKSFDEIDFDSLPNQFVLKTTHDSGGVIICHDKKYFNTKNAKRRIDNWLKRDFFYMGREWPYKNVQHRILAEKYMQQEDGSGLIDYKFFCFNGEPRFLYVSKGLDHHPTAKISFYDMDGKEMYFHRKDYNPYHGAIMPDNFDLMKTMAKKLAEEVNSPFIRVDLYSINGDVYCSELTFSPCGGMLPFEPASADYELGKLLKLSIDTKND